MAHLHDAGHGRMAAPLCYHILRTLQRGELRGRGFIDFVSRSNYRL